MQLHAFTSCDFLGWWVEGGGVFTLKTPTFTRSEHFEIASQGRHRIYYSRHATENPGGTRLSH